MQSVKFRGGPAEFTASVLEREPLLVEAHLWTGIAEFTHWVGIAPPVRHFGGHACWRHSCGQPPCSGLAYERRGRWEARAAVLNELARTLQSREPPGFSGTLALENALPGWRGEAFALALQRNSTHCEQRSPPISDVPHDD